MLFKNCIYGQIDQFIHSDWSRRFHSMKMYENGWLDYSDWLWKQIKRKINQTVCRWISVEFISLFLFVLSFFSFCYFIQIRFINEKKSKYNKKLENEFFDKKKTKMKQMTEEMKQQLVGEVFKWNNIKIIHFLFWWIISFFHSIFLNLKIKIKTSFN